MNYYIELNKKNVTELVIKLISGEFEEESGINFSIDEIEKLKEIILDKSELKEGGERKYDITAILYYKTTIGEIDRFILDKVKLKKNEPYRQQITRVYLQYRELRSFRDELKDFIDQEDFIWWKNYSHRLVSYITLVNLIQKAIGLRNFKKCKIKCDNAKNNIFNCTNCTISNYFKQIS